jgi:hypothetical protein
MDQHGPTSGQECAFLVVEGSLTAGKRTFACVTNYLPRLHFFPLERCQSNCRRAIARILGDTGILICQGSHAFDVDQSFPLARLV